MCRSARTTNAVVSVSCSGALTYSMRTRRPGCLPNEVVTVRPKVPVQRVGCAGPWNSREILLRSRCGPGCRQYSPVLRSAAAWLASAAMNKPQRPKTLREMSKAKLNELLAERAEYDTVIYSVNDYLGELRNRGYARRGQADILDGGRQQCRCLLRSRCRRGNARCGPDIPRACQLGHACQSCRAYARHLGRANACQIARPSAHRGPSQAMGHLADAHSMATSPPPGLAWKHPLA